MTRGFRFKVVFLILAAVLVLLAVLPSPAAATGYYRNVDGYYVYHGYPGYYWSGNNAYVAQYYTVPGYYSYGYYYPPVQRYRYVFAYTYYPQATTYNTASSVTYGGDWKNRVLALAQKRDEAEAKMRAGVLDQMYFIQTLEKMGLQGNFGWQNYGQFPSLYGQTTGYAHTSYGAYPPVPQGNTQYGYSGRTYNQTSQLYGDLNVNQLYQSMFQMAANVQKASTQVTSEVGGLVGQAGENHAKVAAVLAKTAEYKAKADGAVAILKGLEGSSSKTTTNITTFKVVPGPDGPELKPDPPPPPMPPAPDQKPPDVQPAKVDAKAADAGQAQGRAVWLAGAKQDCGACHGGGKKEGGFAIEEYPAMTLEQKVSVINRLITHDEKKRMPRTANGGVGERVGIEKLKQWLSN